MSIEHIFGIENLESAMANAGTDLVFRQLAPGTLGTRTWMLPHPQFSVLFLGVDLAVEAVGAYQPGFVIFQVPVEDMILTHNGEVASRQDWLLLRDNTESSANCNIASGGVLIFYIASSLLEQYRASLYPDLQLPMASVTRLRPDASSVQEVLQTVREWRADRNHFSPVNAGDRIITVLLETLAARDPSRTARKDWSRVSKHRVCKRVREYIEHNHGSDITIVDLCRHAEVSHSSLGRAFREELGMSPLAYLTAYRLHALRAELVSGLRPERTISSLAQEHGIQHFGRLSRRFGQYFGMPPSRFRELVISGAGQNRIAGPKQT